MIIASLRRKSTGFPERDSLTPSSCSTASRDSAKLRP